MTIQFRNLDVDTTTPIDRWPAEAIETIIDRGSLSDWRQLAQAIRRNPWGPAARTTETVVSWGEHYGVDALMSGVIRHAREDITHRGRAAYAEQIRGWRTQSRHDAAPVRPGGRHLGVAAVRLREREGRTDDRRARQAQPCRGDSARGDGTETAPVQSGHPSSPGSPPRARTPPRPQKEPQRQLQVQR